MKTCFFIGHRECTEEILPEVRKAVEGLIVEHGVSQFIVGSYGGFDSVAAAAVKQAKKEHPEILLSQLIPYHPAERPVELGLGLTVLIIPLRIKHLHGNMQS